MSKDLVMIALGSIALSLACFGLGMAAGARPLPPLVKIHARTLDAGLGNHRCCRVVAFNRTLILEA